MSQTNEVKLSRHVPFGYRREPAGELVPDPVEAPIRKELYELFLRHGRKKTVAKLLNEAGHRTRDGSLFSDATIGRLLRDPIVTGAATSTFKIEPLISEEVWRQCQELLQHPVPKTPAHLFAGIVQCACGTKMYVPTNSDKYVCANCRRKVPARRLENIFFDQFKTCFLVPLETGSEGGELVQNVQIWPHFTPEEKRQVVESMTQSIVVADRRIDINLYYLPSVKDMTNWQHEQIGNKSGERQSTRVHESPLRFNVDTRELRHGETSLTYKLNETTRNFLTVLALNITNGIHLPLELDRPFADGASCTTRNALDTLRKQIGAVICKRLIKTERGSATRPGGVRLQNVEIAGVGKREITLNPEAVHAAKSNRTGQSARQRKPLSGEHFER
ncbi:MAG: recombinase family protein [Candidatus Pacebacteria bacterium]|nr:recombinase family protein [Candidatus Paceibacterota bacterium]